MFSSVYSTFAIALVASASLAGAVPHAHQARQLGNLQCNVNRLNIVGAVRDMHSNVDDLQQAVASDPASSGPVSDAQSGLQNCDDGISTIAKSIFSGQKAPPEARDLVAKGLVTIAGALTSINSTDPAVTKSLSDAKTNLVKAIQAGENVVALCK